MGYWRNHGTISDFLSDTSVEFPLGTPSCSPLFNWQLFQQSETNNPDFPLLPVLSSIQFNPTGQQQVVWAVRSSRLVAPRSFQIQSEGSRSWTLLHPMIAVATATRRLRWLMMTMTTTVFSPPHFVRSSCSIWIYLLQWMKISASLMIFKPPLFCL